LNTARRLQDHWRPLADPIHARILAATGTALDELRLRLVVRHMAVGVDVEVLETQTNHRLRPTPSTRPAGRITR
jgi:hypothetical protein